MAIWAVLLRSFCIPFETRSFRLFVARLLAPDYVLLFRHESLIYNTMTLRDEKEQSASDSSSPLNTIERSANVESSTSDAIVVVSTTLSSLK